MKMSSTVAAISIAFLIGACGESPTGSLFRGELLGGDKYLVFGRFFGECRGESCVEIFKLKGNHLFEDVLDRYPTQNNLPNPTDYRPLSDTEFEKVKDLPGMIPERLFAVDAVRIGEPDAGDWGGFYLETNLSGEVRYWLIDRMKTNVPDYLHSLIDALDAAVDTLQSQTFAYDDYEMEQRFICFCIQPAGRFQRILVRNNEIVSVVDVETQAELDSSQFDLFKTIAALNDFIAGIDPNEVAVLNVEYDETYGYPKNVYVDYDYNLADEEIGYETRNFKPLRQ